MTRTENPAPTLVPVLFISVGDGRVRFRHSGEAAAFALDDVDGAKEWLRTRSYAVAICSSSVDHPDEYGADADAVQRWLDQVFDRRRTRQISVSLTEEHILLLDKRARENGWSRSRAAARLIIDGLQA